MEELKLKTGLEEDSSTSTEIPDIIGGVAAPKKRRGRPPGSKNPPKLPLADMSTNGNSPSLSTAKTRIKVNLAAGVGTEMVSQLARAPVFLADMGITVASKGKLAPVNFIKQEQWEAIDRVFTENVLEGGLEIEATPIQAWLITCAIASLSGVVAQTAHYAFSLKKEAGTLPNANGQRNGASGGTGEHQASSASDGMAQGIEHRSGETPTA